MQNHVSASLPVRNHFKSLTEKHGRNHDFLRKECEIKQINKKYIYKLDIYKIIFI
jgi:hypothetical protein